jgi:glycosyltransferase involved in cell wall biosynthesis
VSRVLVFAERMLPSTQTFILLQVNALRRYVPQYAGLIPAERNALLPHRPILLTQHRSRAARVRRELYRWTGLAPAFHAALLRAHPDLVHAHFAEAAAPALFLSQTLKVPLILHLRGGAELMPDAELRRHLFQLPYLAYRRRLWQRASLFLCVSRYIRERALRAGFPPEKLRVHYTGMDCAAYTAQQSTAQRDANLVLYIGRLVPYKGCDYLLRAMQRVQQQRPAARLVIIGDGDFRPALEALDKECGIGALFLGEQTQQQARAWLERARVFCGPSVTLEDGMSEAFGNVFTEAQAMGVPVVSFDHGGIPETMRAGVTGLLALERDVDQLAAHLLRYIEDDTFWAQSRQAGMEWVRQHFDIHAQTEKLEAIYDAVVRQFRPESRTQVPPPE